MDFGDVFVKIQGFQDDKQVFVVFDEFRAFVCVQDVFQNQGTDTEFFSQLSDELSVMQTLNGDPGEMIVGKIF